MSIRRKKKKWGQYYPHFCATVRSEAEHRRSLSHYQDMSKDDTRARNVMFTVFAPRPSDKEQRRRRGEGAHHGAHDEEGAPSLRLLDPLLWDATKLRFVIYQRELCSTTQREHFQGYLELLAPMTYKALHEWTGLETAHFEPRYGNQRQAIHYCTKPHKGCQCSICEEERRADTYLEGPWLFGEPANQGRRTELLNVKSDLDQLRPMAQIRDEHFATWVQFRHSFTDYKRLKTASRAHKTQVLMFVGPSGVGKSTLVYRLAPYLTTPEGSAPYILPQKKGSGLYWDDYDGQDVVIMDEFDGSVMPPKFFNVLADRHPCTVPVHGGAGHQFISKYLLIATNYAPRYWWKGRLEQQLFQTTRRIDVVFKMGCVPRPKKRLIYFNPETRTFISYADGMAPQDQGLMLMSAEPDPLPVPRRWPQDYDEFGNEIEDAVPFESIPPFLE